ncbi:MAG: hypothetical protein HOP02_08430 [Methylococcaceae bacterium]|nr:hypothetical protein [Methylococcaceae bacterium]
MFSTLNKEPLGRIVLANIQCAYDHEHIERDLLISFLKAWKAAYISYAPIYVEEIINLIHNIADKEVKYRFQHKAKPQMPDKVSTIIRWEILHKNLNIIELNQMGIEVSNSAEYEEHFFTKVAAAFDEHPKILNDGTYGYLDYNDGQFWITPSDWIEKLRHAKPANLANQVRDILGLVHFNSNVALFELCFLATAIHPNNKATPTFIEAEAHQRFKAHNNPADNEGWGSTVYLQRSYKEGIRTGESELFARQVPLYKANGQLKAIGLTTEHAEWVDPNDEAAILNMQNEFVGTFDLRSEFVTWLNDNI